MKHLNLLFFSALASALAGCSAGRRSISTENTDYATDSRVTVMSYTAMRDSLALGLDIAIDSPMIIVSHLDGSQSKIEGKRLTARLTADSSTSVNSADSCAGINVSALRRSAESDSATEVSNCFPRATIVISALLFAVIVFLYKNLIGAKND